MKWVVSIIVLLMGASVSASTNCDTEVEFGMYTHHLITPREYVNEINEFFGITHCNFQFATFLNSFHGRVLENGDRFDGRSYALGYRIEPTRNMGIGFGGIHGYDEFSWVAPSEITFDNTIFYVSGEVAIWGDQLQSVFFNKLPRFVDENVAVRGRMFGEVFTVNLVVMY